MSYVTNKVAPKASNGVSILETGNWRTKSVWSTEVSIGRLLLLIKATAHLGKTYMT